MINMVIGANIQKVGYSAFDHQHGLMFVYLPKCKEFGTNCFNCCYSLVNCIAPFTKKIGKECFSWCFSMQDPSYKNVK